MKEADRKKRNDTRLLELYPTFRERVQKVILSLESKGLRPRIQDAWRSLADQAEKYRSGQSQVRFGFHNITAPNGTRESLAVDLLDDDAPLSPSNAYLLQLAAAAEEAGLITGIRWGLDAEQKRAIDTAIALQDWDADVTVSWDPWHVEPTDVTIDEAKAGKRPM